MFTFDIGAATKFDEYAARRLVAALQPEEEQYTIEIREIDGQYVVAEVDEDGNDIHYVRFGKVW